MTPRNKCRVKCDFGPRRWVLIRWFSLPLLQVWWDGGEEVAEANCARDRENKLSPVAATTLFRAHDMGDDGCWGRWNGRPVSRREFSFFFRHQRCCLNASAREYLVTTAARTRYSFISHYQVRATILCLHLPPSPRLHTDRWSLELPRCCRSTCRSPSRNIVINLRGIKSSWAPVANKEWRRRQVLNAHRDLLRVIAIYFSQYDMKCLAYTSVLYLIIKIQYAKILLI